VESITKTVTDKNGKESDPVSVTSVTLTDDTGNEYELAVNKTYPQAQFNTDTRIVEWNLEALKTLMTGYTYTVSFIVWPNQTAYDLFRDLNDDTARAKILTANITGTEKTYESIDALLEDLNQYPSAYESLNDRLKEFIYLDDEAIVDSETGETSSAYVSQISYVNGKYTLNTNTKATKAEGTVTDIQTSFIAPENVPFDSAVKDKTVTETSTNSEDGSTTTYTITAETKTEDGVEYEYTYVTAVTVYADGSTLTTKYTRRVDPNLVEFYRTESDNDSLKRIDNPDPVDLVEETLTVRKEWKDGINPNNKAESSLNFFKNVGQTDDQAC